MQDSRVLELKLADINADEEFNCRGKITPLDVVDLVKDIERHGLLQPVLVMSYNDAEKIKYGRPYKLIAGFRRYMAHIVLQKGVIRCVVKEHSSEAQATLINFTENIQRKDLDIIQEAKALTKLKQLGIGEAEAAESLGMSRGWVQVRYMLLSLPDDVKNEVKAGFISQTDIRDLYSILSVSGVQSCYNAAKELKEAKISGRKSMTLKTTKKNLNSKRLRTKPEIFEVQTLIREQMGNNIGTQCLAWAAGEITTADLYSALEQYAIANDLNFLKPAAVV